MLAFAAVAIPTLAALAEVTLDAPPLMAGGGVPPNDTVWTDVLELGVLGRGWNASELSSPFVRLPTRAQSVLCSAAPCASPCPSPQCTSDRCDVWGLAQSSTGLHVRFSTTAATVHVRFTMVTENGDWLWAVNGHSGVDVYAQVEGTTAPGEWRWATSSGNNPGTEGGSLSAAILAQPGPGPKTLTATLGPMGPVLPGGAARNFTLYLPCRGLLHSAAVGVAPGSGAVKPVPPPPGKPVTVYGTSILHGAAAGRAGMVWSSQMGRVLDKQVVNLGFSGHGLMQREVAGLLAEVDASVYVLDCEYNMDKFNSSTVECLTHDFVSVLRAARPDTPVLLIEGHDGTRNWIVPELGQNENSTRNGYRRAYNRLVAEGDAGVFYLNGSGKLGGPVATDFEAQVGAVGGVHVSNYAFTHYARYVGDAVRAVLNGTAKASPVAVLPEAPPPPPAPAVPFGDWVEATELGLEGVGWPDEPPRYGRLPARAESVLATAAPDTAYTFNLSQCSSGVLARFATDATEIEINVLRRSLGSGLLSLDGRQDDIMPYNGRFGLDVYASDEDNGGAWRWFDTSRNGAQQANETLSLTGLAPPRAAGGRKFTVYFPTHIAVDSLRVRVPRGSQLAPYRPHAEAKPIAIWASSIGQGGVVQNAGLTWIVDVGRILDREVLNLGFSGNCRMQPAVAKFLVELKPEVFVMDCLPNMDAATVSDRAPSALKQLRDGLGPHVPIVVLEGHTYTNAWIVPGIAEAQAQKRAAQRAAFDAAAKTDPNLHYVSGDGKLASLGATAWHDATSGFGVHPTSIAHLHIAQYVAAALKPLLPS